MSPDSAVTLSQVRAVLLAQGLAESARMTPGFHLQRDGGVHVFWTYRQGIETTRRARTRGLALVRSALEGRFVTTLHGCHYVDGEAVCVRVIARTEQAQAETSLASADSDLVTV